MHFWKGESPDIKEWTFTEHLLNIQIKHLCKSQIYYANFLTQRSELARYRQIGTFLDVNFPFHNIWPRQNYVKQIWKRWTRRTLWSAADALLWTCREEESARLPGQEFQKLNFGQASNRIAVFFAEWGSICLLQFSILVRELQLLYTSSTYVFL
jgi:hypothetical protein